MFIVRDGKEIKLTAYEIGSAYYEHKRECLKEDITTVIEENGYSTDVLSNPKEMNTLTDAVLDRLDDDNTINETYWDIIRRVTDNYLL